EVRRHGVVEDVPARRGQPRDAQRHAGARHADQGRDPAARVHAGGSGAGAHRGDARMSGRHGFTLWFTGLSGAGKSTLAVAVGDVIAARGRNVEILDGDEVRTNLSKGLGFSKEDRDTNIRRIGYVARLLSRNGVATITAAISPYRDVRAEVRRLHEATFVEAYIECPIEELVR